jgi:hypothetical protein
MEDFFRGRRLESALKIYYAEETMLGISGMTGTKFFLLGHGELCWLCYDTDLFSI